jgi:hypothetical protein
MRVRSGEMGKKQQTIADEYIAWWEHVPDKKDENVVDCTCGSSNLNCFLHCLNDEPCDVCGDNTVIFQDGSVLENDEIWAAGKVWVEVNE